MNDALILLVIFGSVFGTIVMLSYFKNRRIERTSLIAAGKEASIFSQEEKKPLINKVLKYGILFIGEGIGLLIGDYLAKSTNLAEPIAYLSMIFLFGGISLLIYYILHKKLDV